MTDDRSPRLSGATPTDDDSPVLGGQAATLHLVEMLQAEDETVRQRAMFQLAERGDGRVFEHLRDLANHREQHTRQRVAWSLGYLITPEARDLLIDMALTDGVWSVRQTAGRLLRRYPLEDVLPAIEETTPTNLEHAAEALGHLCDERVEKAITAIMHEAETIRQLRAAVRVLGTCYTASAFDTLAGFFGGNDILNHAGTQALWRQNWPEAVPLLEKRIMLNLGKDTLKETIYALGHMADRATAESLVPRFIDTLTSSGEQYVRLAVIDALGCIATPAALEALATHAPKESDWFNQLNLGRALKPHMNDDLRAILRQHLTEGSGDNLLNTLDVLKELTDPTFDPDLIALFATLDASDDDQQTMMRDIAETVRDADFLRNLLDHPNEGVRGGALDGLAQLGVSGRLPDALRGNAPYPMWRALAASMELGDPVILQPLLEAEEGGLAEHDTNLWLRALATCGTEAAIPRIATYLDHSIVDHRAYAARTLGELGARDYVPQLLHMAVSDPHPWGPREAAKALGKFGDERALPLLRHMAAYHHDYDGRKSAIGALGMMRDAAAVDILIEALRWDNQADNRAAAATSLGQIGEERALPALAKALGAGHGDVRAAAVEAIGRIDAEAARADLERLIGREPHRRTREAALGLL